MTRTAKTRFSIINDMLMKAILAEGSTNGKNSGMMILVTQLAIIVYIVSDVMLPPSFSVMTAAAAAVENKMPCTRMELFDFYFTKCYIENHK